MMRHCPLCSAAYAPGAAVLIERRDDAELVHVACSVCQGAVLTLVRTAPFGISSIAAMTDLSVTDMKRLQRIEPISEDDMLSFHRFLQTAGNLSDTLAG